LIYNKSFALFVWTYQQNQQPSSSVFLLQQTSEQCFQHNKPAKRTGRLSKHFDHLCVVFGENYSYGPLKIHPYFLGPKNFELTCLTSNPTFVSLFGLSVNLTL
jgi:hypothetical protein